MARSIMRFVVVGALAALQLGAVSPAARANSTLGSFEIDGNLADDSGSGEPIDWATFPSATGISDLSASTKDDIFGNGSKELDPANWSCVLQKPPGKDDIVSGQIGFRRVNGKQFAYINYFRKEVNGDAHMDFEFNKSSTPVSTSCGSISRRTPGDILLSFDTENGGAQIFVRAFTWNGTSFDEATLGQNADGAVNIPPSLTIPKHANGDFGEGAINLTDTIGEVQCGEFSGAYMKTRSSTSIDAALKDYTKPVKINPDNCPASSLAKGVRKYTDTTTAPFTTSTTASPGDTLQYQLTYANAGPGTAQNVVVTDPIGANQAFLAGSCSPSCTTTTDTSGKVTSVSWGLGDVAPTGSSPKVMTFKVRLPSTFPAGTTAVTDTGSVTTTQEGSKDSNTVTTTVTAAPVDAFSKGVRNVTGRATTFTTTSDAAPGDTLEYQLSYDNTGNAPAGNVVLSDPIPAHTAFVSCSDSCATTTSNGVVTAVSWTVGTVAPSDPVVTRTFTVLVDSTGFTQGAATPITNVATVCTAQNPACTNSPPVTVTVKTPDLRLVKNVRDVTTGTAFGTSTAARPGDVLEYRLQLTNPGTAAATHVTVSDVIQQYQTYLSCTSPAGYASCTTTGSPVTGVTWTLGTVGAGTTSPITLTFQVRLAPTFPAGVTSVKDTATDTSDQQGTLPSNETQASVTAAPVSVAGKGVRDVTADPSGTTYSSSTTANPGDVLEYQLSYDNTGNAAASNVVLSDPIPAHTAFLSCSDHCETTVVDGIVTKVSWSLGTVAPSDPVVYRTFQVTLDRTGFTPGTTTSVQNVATACSAEEAACASSPPVTVSVTSPKSALAKAVRVLPSTSFVTSATAKPGDLLEYRLTYTNLGPGTATNVVISDPVPARSTWQSCSPTCATTGTPVSSVSWTFASVAPSTSQVVYFTVRLAPTFPAGSTAVTNTGSAQAAEETASTPSNTVTVTVTAVPNLTLGKSAADAAGNPLPAVVASGQTITYTITYGNTGDAPASGTVITEAVPAGTTYVSCTNDCVPSGTPVSTVTWSVGTVNPGTPGAVTMTVAVNDTVGCTIVNVAHASSPDQSNGTAVDSNPVTLTAQPSDNPAGAHATGSGLGASVTADLPLVGPINQQLSPTSSSQSGVGRNATENQAAISPVLVPADGSVLRADVLRTTSTGTVTRTPAEAQDLSTAQALGVRVLGTLVTADVVDAVATATADGGSSTYSSAGSTFKNLRVQGIAYNNVAPNTRLDLGDITGIGLGVHVGLLEQVGSTSTPAGTSGGTYASDLKVAMIHVVVDDGNILKGGKQPIEVIVSQAKAHADFPQTRVCTTSPTRLVSGHADILGATVTDPTGLAVDPNVLSLMVDDARVLPQGGQQDVQTDHAALPDSGSLATADVAESFASGGIGATSTGSYDFASAANVCLKLTSDGTCTISATAVRSVSSSSASGTSRSSYDSYGSDVTTLVGLRVMGMSLADYLASQGLPALPVPAGVTPPPNTVVPLGPLGSIVLNEQVCDGNGTLANHCADATNGHAGLTVRAIHVVLLDGTPPVADVVVAEAHSDATWK